MNLDFFKRPVLSLNGFTVTVGTLVIVALVVYFLFFRKR